MIAKNFGEVPARGDLEPVDEAVLAVVRDGFDTVGDLIGRHRPRAADRRGDAGGRRGEQVPHRHRALQDEGRVAARPAGDGAPRRGPVRARLQHPARAVPAALLQQGVAGARRRGRVHADAARRAGGGPRPRRLRQGAGLHVYPIITGDYSATPPWRHRPIEVGTTSTSRPRCSPSSTRRSSTRSWRGSPPPRWLRCEERQRRASKPRNRGQGGDHMRCHARVPVGCGGFQAQALAGLRTSTTGDRVRR